MSTTQVSSDASENAGVKNVDMKLEVVTIPVSDVDRATEFYVGLGWRQDVTPPGSGCPVNAVRLKLLGPVRHESHIRRAEIRQNTF